MIATMLGVVVLTEQQPCPIKSGYYIKKVFNILL